jgi:effector-binding domain-containing protein
VGHWIVGRFVANMITDKILLKDIPLRTIAYLKCRGSSDQLPDALEMLLQRMAEKRLKPTGPPSGIYHNTTKETAIQDLEWEVSCPVKTRLIFRTTGGWESGVRRIPGTKVAFLYHEGPQRTAGSTYRLLEEWMLEHGLKIGGPAEEVYLTDFTVPEANMVTEIRIPVRSP